MFSKKSTPPAGQQPTRTQPSMAGGSTFSVFGADIAITGDVKAEAELHVDGRIEGDIACKTLVQGAQSEVVGAVVADSARLAGRIRGSITVGELVVLKSARIEGDVNYDTLTIEQGAEVDGRLAHRAPSTASARSEEPEPAPTDDGNEPRLILASQN
jgi:cytoskeletal protein CcmA (bactofilin family)